MSRTCEQRAFPQLDRLARAPTPGPCTPLYRAIEADMPLLAAKLLQVDESIPSGFNPICWAVRTHALKCLRLLCSIRPTDVNRPDDLGNYPLYYALRDQRLQRLATTRRLATSTSAGLPPDLGGQMQAVDMLLEAGASFTINDTTEGSFNAFHQAASTCEPPLLRNLLQKCPHETRTVLLRQAVDRNSQKSGMTPLGVAVTAGNVDNAVLLVEFGSDPSSVIPSTGASALHAVCFCTRPWTVVRELVERLVAKGLESSRIGGWTGKWASNGAEKNKNKILHAQNRDGIRPVHLAAFIGKFELTRYLADSIDLLTPTKVNRLTPLGAAVAGRSAETIEAVLEKHVPTAVQGPDSPKLRYTPLLAINSGRWGVDANKNAPPNVCAFQFFVSTSDASSNIENDRKILTKLFEALKRFCDQDRSRPVPTHMLDNFYSHVIPRAPRETASGLIDAISSGNSTIVSELLQNDRRLLIGYQNYHVLHQIALDQVQNNDHPTPRERREEIFKLVETSFKDRCTDLRDSRTGEAQTLLPSYWKLYYGVYGNHNEKLDNWRFNRRSKHVQPPKQADSSETDGA